MISLSKNSAITFSSQILILVLGIIIMIILARALGPTGKGIYTLIILISAVLLRLGTLGIEAANVYFTGSKKYEVRDIVSNSLIDALLLGLILILLFWRISHFNIFQNFLNSNQINPFYLWLVVLTVPFSLLSTFLDRVLLGKEEIVKFNKVNIFQPAFQLATIIIFLLILKQGVFGATFSYVLSVIGAVLFVVFLIKKIAKIRFSFNPKLSRDSVIYGGKAYFGILAQFLNCRLSTFLVAAFLTPAAVGFYSIAVGIAERLWIIPGAVATVLFSRISSLKDAEANNLTPRVARHTFVIIFILSLMLAILAKPLIKILFGSAFLPSVMPLLILLPGITALGGAKILTADLAGRGRPEFTTMAAVSSLAVNIPLSIFLIPKWGISGAAFASTVAYTLVTVIVIIVFTKISQKSWSEVLLIKTKDFLDYRRIFNKIKKDFRTKASKLI